jgi:hypothetical protein
MRKQESNRGYHSVVFVACEAVGVRGEEWAFGTIQIAINGLGRYQNMLKIKGFIGAC